MEVPQVVLTAGTFVPVKYPPGSAGPSRVEAPGSASPGVYIDSPPSSKIATLGLYTERWQPIEFSRPSVIVPFELTPNPAVLHLKTYISPLEPNGDASINDGGMFAVPGFRGRCYIPTPGLWYVRPFAGNGVTDEPISYAVFDVTDRDHAQTLLKPETQEVVSVVGDVAVPANTLTQLISMADMYNATWVLVQNLGANTCRVGFRPTVPEDGAAGTGILLAAVGASNAPSFVRFERENLPLAEINAESDAGVSLAVSWGRSNG